MTDVLSIQRDGGPDYVWRDLGSLPFSGVAPVFGEKFNPAEPFPG